MNNEVSAAHRGLAAAVCGLMLAMSTPGPARAGRPLAVDDAGTNVKGEGHVEVWAAHADGTTTLNVAPAYAVRDGVELAAQLSRDAKHDLTGSAVQVKALLTPSREHGCNVGATLGAQHVRAAGARADGAFVNGLASCNGLALGNLHLNLGATRTSGRSTQGTWGVALERALGAVTTHVEVFGGEGSKPAWQIGARRDIAKSVQLDGTIGSVDGMTLLSVGTKLRF